MGTSVRDLEYMLEKVLGFERDEKGGHIHYGLIVNGRPVAKTKLSHSWRSNTEISDQMLSLMAKQMRCSNKMWKALLLGNATKEDYFRELLANGYINQEEFDSLSGKI